MDMDFDIITSCLKKGWETFKDNAVAYIVAPLLMALIGFIVGVLVFMLGGGMAFVGALTGSGALTGGMFLLGGLIGLIVTVLVIMPLFLSMYYMAVKGLKGEKVTIGDVFYPFKNNYVKNLIFLIVYFVVCFILCLIPIIGWIILAVFLLYAPYIYIVAPSEGPVYALKESFNVAKENLIMTIVAIIVFCLLSWIGSMLIIVWLVTLPIATIFLAAVLKELKPDLGL